MWLKWTRWLPVYSWFASSISVHTSFKWGEMTRESITLFLGFENFCSWTLMNQQRHNTGRDPCSLWSRWWIETLDESLSIRGRKDGKKAGWANDSRTREKRDWQAQKIKGCQQNEGRGESERVAKRNRLFVSSLISPRCFLVGVWGSRPALCKGAHALCCSCCGANCLLWDTVAIFPLRQLCQTLRLICNYLFCFIFPQLINQNFIMQIKLSPVCYYPHLSQQNAAAEQGN